MRVLPTLSDLPSDRPNCGNCTRHGKCARSSKEYPNGYVVNPHTREITGMIVGCPQWAGKITKSKKTI